MIRLRRGQGQRASLTLYKLWSALRNGRMDPIKFQKRADHKFFIFLNQEMAWLNWLQRRRIFEHSSGRSAAKLLR